MSHNTNNKTLLGRQKKIIYILIIPVILLVIGAVVLPGLFEKDPIITKLPKVDAETGDTYEYYLIKSKDGSDVKVTETETHTEVEAYSDITYSVRTYLYPEIPVTEIKEVTVTNLQGEYSMYLDSGTGNHFMKGNENQSYKQMEFSMLRVQSRVMYATEKLEGIYDTEEKLVPYGLDAASNPIKVRVTETSGETHTVYIGKMLVSGDGYYAKDEDPYVYVLDSSVSVFFEDKNYFIDPVITYPLTQNQYQYAGSFSIKKNGELFMASEMTDTDSFSGSSSLHNITYPGFYPASIANYYDALECFANLTGESVVETGVLMNGEENAAALFDKYGFTVASNDVSLTTGGVEFRFLTGNKFNDENGVPYYYAYSTAFDTIVTLPVSNAPFLEYELLDFINSSFYQINIADVKEIEFNAGGNDYLFVLEGEGNSLVVKEQLSGKTVDTASFRQLYFSMLNTRIEGYAGAEDVTGNRELTYTVRKTSGDALRYDFSVISTTRELITSNGNSSFYTSRSNITEIIERIDKIMKGEKIDPDY